MPPHVFCLLRRRRDLRAGASPTRRPASRRSATSAIRPGPPSRPSGATLPTREAIAEAVKAARALAGGRLSRASVVFPDAWTAGPRRRARVDSGPVRRGPRNDALEAEEAPARPSGGPVDRLRADAGAHRREAGARRGHARGRPSSPSSARSRSPACGSGTSRPPASRSSRASRPRSRPRPPATTPCSTARAARCPSSSGAAPRRSSTASGRPRSTTSTTTTARRGSRSPTTPRS